MRSVELLESFKAHVFTRQMGECMRSFFGEKQPWRMAAEASTAVRYMVIEGACLGNAGAFLCVSADVFE